MTETTVPGAHYLDIGEGPTPLTSAAIQVVEAAAREAYRTYADHSLNCDECKRRLWNCYIGKRLWAAFREASA